MNISTTQTFQRLIEMMRSLEKQGVKFCVQTPDGMEFKSVVPIGAAGHSRKTIDRGGVRLVDLFRDKLNAMQAGDFAVFEMPQNIKNLDPESWKSAITASCSTTFGKGNYTTSSVPRSGDIEVLRMK